MTLLDVAPVTAAGAQWKWQLRDKNGRWIQMGSEVSFTQGGKSFTGTIIGSPGPGKATVKLADGTTVTVATAGVTATGRVTPSTPQPQTAKPQAKSAKQTKAVVPGLKNQTGSTAKKNSQTGSTATGSTPATRKRRMDSINAIDRTARDIEDLIRARAKKKGRKDPFEETGSSKSKAGGSKNGKESSDKKGGSTKGSSTGSKKPRKDTRKKLTQSQIDAVGDIMKGVLADVKRGSYSAALAKLNKAEKLLENTSAPWFSKKINFLQKGLKGSGMTASGVALVARGDGPSWTWQLRDRLGQWIEMHSEVRWLARGKVRTGHVVDSPGVKTAVVIEDVTGKRVNLSTSRLTGFGDHRFSSTPEVAGPYKGPGPLVVPRRKPLSASDYMALRTLRMSVIKGFGGDIPQKHATEFGLARNNALQALDGAAQRDVSVPEAVERLTEARRQLAAARAWSDLESRRARLLTLEAQIQQIIARLDPDSVPKPKKAKTPAAPPPLKIRARWAEHADEILTAAGNSWKWQLRDSKGQWIEMGSEVKWLANGLPHVGKVVNSPEPGVAIVEDDQGNQVRMPSSRLSLQNAPGTPKVAAPTLNRRERRQERKQQKAALSISKQTPAMEAAMQDMAENIRTDVDPKNWNAAIEATGEVIVGEVAGRLPRRLQLLERVKEIRERGLDAQIRLAVYFHTRPVLEKHLAKAKLWAEEALGDMSGTDNPTPSWSAIPTLIGLPNPASHPVEFLQESGKMINQLLKAASSLMASAVTAAGGDSWRWQLRDKDGQWVDMGSRVSWLAKGMLRTGILIGSPKEGTARVRDDKTGEEFNMPSATRLTALPEVGNKIRYTTGGKNPKAILAEVVGLPKPGRVTVKDLRTGKEKTVAEKTVKVLPLDRIREATKEYGGLSIKIEGVEPKTGFMAAQLKGSKQLTPEEFFGDAGEDALFDFMRENQAQFDSDPDVYLGLWYDEKDNKVVIDVSHNIQDRDTAVLAGRYQDQKSIWDVVNMEEIDTGGTGGYGEAREDVRPPAQEGVGNDGSGVAGLGQAADLGTPAAVDDRKWIRRPPPVGGLRVADARSSMAAFGPQEWAFINNDGGTLADPKHIKDGVGNMSASMSDVIAHYDEVIRDGLQGIPQHPNVDLAKLADAPNWYQRANETSQALLEKYQDQIPGLTLMQVTGVMAAISPRMGWTDNVTNAEKILKKWADPEFRALPISESRGLTAAGMHDNVEIGLKILHGDGPEVMTGLKRKSFWNCMLDPTNTWDVCMDGWMASATRRAGLKNLDGGDLDESALAWLDHGLNNQQTETVDGAGYVVIADALRIAAARNGLTPMQAQAVYWIAVGGDAEGAVMWTDEKRKSGTSPLALRKARQREARLAEQLQARPGESTSGASVPVSIPVGVVA